MRVKLKLKNGWDNELEIYKSYCNIPFIDCDNKKLNLEGKKIGFEVSKNVWLQLPESLKKDLYNTSFNSLVAKKFIYLKNAYITMSNISAYHIILNNNEEKGEIFDIFNKKKTIMEFETINIFSNSYFQFYVQCLGDIYLEFDTNDIIKNIYNYEDEFLKKIEKSYKRGSLREIYKKIENTIEKKIENINNFNEWIEEVEEILSYDVAEIEDDVLILERLLKLLGEDIYFINIPEKIKDELGFWILKLQFIYNLKSKKNIMEEILLKLNLEKLKNISIN